MRGQAEEKMRRTIAIVLCLLPTSASAEPKNRFSWMLGDWCTTASDGTRTCEHWRRDRRGRMVGEGSTIKAGKTVEQERLRIRTRGGQVYYEASLGGPITAFRRTLFGARSATFTNTMHDYPQRIRYWREGRNLLAEIALADGSKAMQWRYDRQ
jgi:hypothetical protein